MSLMFLKTASIDGFYILPMTQHRNCFGVFSRGRNVPFSDQSHFIRYNRVSNSLDISNYLNVYCYY